MDVGVGEEDRWRKENKHFGKGILFCILTDEKTEAIPDHTSKIAETLFKPRANDSRVITFSQYLILTIDILISGEPEIA